MTQYKDLWVYIEVENKRAKSVGLELLGPGRELADQVGEKLVAFVIGWNLVLEYSIGNYFQMSNHILTYLLAYSVQDSPS
jgi:hypothetical protein